MTSSHVSDRSLVERAEVEEIILLTRVEVLIYAECFQSFAPLLLNSFLVVLLHDFDPALLLCLFLGMCAWLLL